VQALQPSFAVSLVEELGSSWIGKKKGQRAVKHSVLCYQELMKTKIGTKWLAPVIIEEPKLMLE
jgi:hypothetical protein